VPAAPPSAVPLALAALLLAAAPGAAATHGKGAACTAVDCHEGTGRAPERGTGHAPAAGGECGACHDADGGGPALLRLGDGGDRELCAGCHEAPAAAARDAGVRTAFADGGRDLHGVHVRAAGRGRACLGCHAPHAAAQERLLRTEIAGRGGMRISQRFEPLPGGGRCTTRCHAPKEYRRAGGG